MPTINRIAIFGIGRIGKLIYSGTDALCAIEKNTARNNEDFLDSLTRIVNKYDFKTLVDSYKNVQKKYYPEKDMYKNM